MNSERLTRAMKRKLETNAKDDGVQKKMKSCEKIQVNNHINAGCTSKIYVLNIELEIEEDANVVINIKRKGEMK